MLGFPLACALAWAFDVTPQGIERTPAPGSVHAGSPPAAAARRRQPRRPRCRPPRRAPAASVAILPFADLSPAHDHEYFCDGIADEIINALCCIRGLRVASRTSSFQFKGRAADVREIGRTLDVGAVLEGSVRKSGERVRITAQLVGAADGYHLWSDSFDRGLEDVFATQTEIAQKLVRALRLSLSPQEVGLMERGGTRNAEAYDLYLRGQALLRDGSDTALPEAAALFSRAVRADPQFAQAQAGLANALAYSGIWGLDVHAADIERALAASRRALALEPRMPEAFVAKGNLLFMQGKAEEAFAAFEEAIRLNPASYEAHYFYARDLFSAGRAQQGVAYYEAAERLRPEEYQPPSMLSTALYSLGRDAEAREAAGRALHAIDARLAVEPDDSRALHLGAVLSARLGQRERAVAYARRAPWGCARANLRPPTTWPAPTPSSACGTRRSTCWTARSARGAATSAGSSTIADFDSLRNEGRFAAIVGRLRHERRGAAQLSAARSPALPAVLLRSSRSRCSPRACGPTTGSRGSSRCCRC